MIFSHNYMYHYETKEIENDSYHCYFHDFVLPFLQFHIFLLMLSVTPLRSNSTKILENVVIFRKESTEVRFVTTCVSFGLNSNF